MRVAVLAIGLGLALAAGAALADEQITTAPKAEKEKVVCKKQVKANSRFAARTCMTAVEWEAQAETARKAFEEVQNRPMVNTARGN